MNNIKYIYIGFFLGKNKTSGPKRDSYENNNGRSRPFVAENVKKNFKLPLLKVDTSTTVSNSKKSKQPHTALSSVMTNENSTSTFNRSTSQRTTTTAKNIATKKQKCTLTRSLRSSRKTDGVVNDTNATMPNFTATEISNIIQQAKHRKINENPIKYTTNYKPSTLFVPSEFPRTISYPFHNNNQIFLDIQKEVSIRFKKLL